MLKLPDRLPQAGETLRRVALVAAVPSGHQSQKALVHLPRHLAQRRLIRSFRQQRLHQQTAFLGLQIGEIPDPVRILVQAHQRFRQLIGPPGGKLQCRHHAGLQQAKKQNDRQHASADHHRLAAAVS